jgi:hypothetical protein
MTIRRKVNTLQAEPMPCEINERVGIVNVAAGYASLTRHYMQCAYGVISLPRKQ